METRNFSDFYCSYEHGSNVGALHLHYPFGHLVHLSTLCPSQDVTYRDIQNTWFNAILLTYISSNSAQQYFPDRFLQTGPSLPQSTTDEPQA